MTTKKKGGKKNVKQLSEDVSNIFTIIEEMRAEMATLKSSVTTQGKHIKTLQSENKRLTHKINKLQLAPMQSSPALTDVECNDETDNDEKAQSTLQMPSSSSSSSKKKKTKGKKGGRQRMTRREMMRAAQKNNNNGGGGGRAGQAIKTQSWQSDHKVFSVGDNGGTAIKPKFKAGSMRFGKFLSFKEDDIHVLRIKGIHRMIGLPSSMAIGFCTEQFGDYGVSNFGNNYCCFVKGTGQYLTSKQFSNDEYEHKCTLSGFRFKEGDTTVQEIDFENKIARMWNASEVPENESNPDPDKVVTVHFPGNRKIAPICYMTGSKKKKFIIDAQEYIYD